VLDKMARGILRTKVNELAKNRKLIQINQKRHRMLSNTKQKKRHCKFSTQQVLSTQFLSCDSAIGLHLLRIPICAQHYDDKQFSTLAKGFSFIRLRSHFY